MSESAPPNRSGRVGQLISHIRTPLYFNSYALMLSHALTSGLGVIYWAVAARLYRPEEVGIDAALISVMLFVTGISQLNLRVALTRLVPESGTKARSLIMAAYAVSVAVTTVVSLAFILLFGATLIPGLSLLQDIPAAAAFVLGSIAWTVFNLQDGVFSGVRRAGWIPVENGLYGLAKMLLLVVLALLAVRNGVLFAFFLPMGVAVVVVNVLLFKRLLPEFELAARGRSLSMGFGRLVRFISGDYVASLFALAYVTLLPILVLVRLGAETGAHFYIVWVIVSSLVLVPQSVTVSMTVETVTANDDSMQQARQALKHMMRITLPLVVAVALAAPLILGVFGPDYASEGTESLRIFALGVLPSAVTAVAMAHARVMGRSADLIAIQAVLAVLIFGIAYPLLDSSGITGVAMGWLAGQTIVATVLLGTRLRPLLRPSTAVDAPPEMNAQP